MAWVALDPGMIGGIPAGATVSISLLLGQRGGWCLGLSCAMEQVPGLPSADAGMRAPPEVVCPAEGMPEYWQSWLVGIMMGKRAVCWDVGRLMTHSPARQMQVSILTPQNALHPTLMFHKLQEIQNSLCTLYIVPRPVVSRRRGRDGT